MATADDRYPSSSDDICHKLGGTAEFLRPYEWGRFFYCMKNFPTVAVAILCINVNFFPIRRLYSC